MPRLWDETIEAHRQAVGNTTLDTTAAPVAEHGLAAVTMARAQQHLTNFFRYLLGEAATANDISDDVAADELAVYTVGA